MVPRDSPEGDHAANGFAESGVRELKGQIWVLKSSLEDKLRKRLANDDVLLAWLPRHAAALLSRYRQGEDGRTSEQRRSGRTWKKPIVNFGDRIMFRPVNTKSARNAEHKRSRRRDSVHRGGGT